MHGASEIIHEAELLPVEERLLVVDSLLRSINPPQPETDRMWIAAAKRRIQELRSGRVARVPGHEVFEKIRTRFAS